MKRVLLRGEAVSAIDSMPVLFLLLLATLACTRVRADAVQRTGASTSQQPFGVSDQKVRISAGVLERVIDLANGNLSTTRLQVSGHELLAGPALELSLTVTRAEPNARPKGLKPGEGGSIDSVRTFQPGRHVDPGTYDDASLGQTTRWLEPVRIQASRWADSLTLATPQVSTPAPDVSRLTVHARARKDNALDGLVVTVVYEVYRGEPVVRKWVEVANESDVWRKIEQLTIDDFTLAPSISERVPLTPAGYGVQPSMIGFSSSDGTFGVIAASEIPSALRVVASTGALGYHPAMFEWVLAPGERFISEPVFLYAFSGPVEQTISARSMPLDRTVESSFQRFLSRHIGIAGERLPCDAPQWLTWANFGPNLNDAMIRQQADLAARSGFVQFLMDDGWQRDRLGTEPDPVKFPDFAATADYIRSRGLKLGLWLSCFRDKDSPDLKSLPDTRSLPVVTRLGGIAMSFTTPGWEEFYAQDLAQLHQRYGVAYFKQDFSNIIYGDLAENHPSRTRKESLLRGLRGLLEAQDRLRALSPDVMNQITHEIYWDTPGAPCDLAALKHAARYHVSPNACGGIVARQTSASTVDPMKVRAELLAACYQARQVFYSHRGLPLYCLEFYGAATEDHQGSLIAEVQDRQVVSWLLGAPLVFSGDLSTLSAEHLAHYQKRFALVNRLNQSWDIYRYCQFSGVPAPNDDDWHWWGKLNDEGCGAVVVVRGSGGAERRAINVPWVKRDRRYAVIALFSERPLGDFTGRQLQSEGIELTLPTDGQEILELTPAKTQWEEADGTRIPIPPAEHPRLYLRAEQVAQLPQRLKDPVLQSAVQRLEAQAKRTPQFKVEWDALQYLVTHDAALGRATIEAALPLLRECVLADKQDACRETGRMMVTGAIVYDWCYSLLSPEEKQAFIKELVRLAGTQECGYPPTGQGSVTGHASEAMIMRDMLSAGIAIYDESPEMYRLAAGRFFREHLPARNWFYPGHAYHQGDSYGPHRYSWDTYPLWIFDRLDAGNVYNPEQHFVPYLWIYTTRPDGQRLRAGDTFACSAPRGQPWSQYIGTLLTASYYGDDILLDQYQRQGGSGGNETIFEVLWRDTSLAAKSISTLPLSRYFESPFGWMVARTGWDANAVIAEMKVNEYNFVNHQHLDAGAFQIYYKGALAIDSGLYEGGSSGNYGSPHCLNYYWRTIAHNSLLVYDPNESFARRGYGNDGGQRLPNGRSEARNLDVLLAPQNGYRTGKVLAHGFGPDPQTPDFTWLRGDLTEAYSKKVRQVTRSFLFLNLHNSRVPAAIIVFDCVVSANPTFRKYWLLHTLEEPRVESASAVVECTQHGNSGRLMLDVLLPAATNADLAKVGGPGKEYWVFGQNYTNDLDPKRLERGSAETGAWRIELSPTTAAAEDLFLTVMQVTDRQSPSHWPVQPMDTGERVGCIVQGPETSWVVSMRKDNKPSSESVSFTLAGDRPSRMLVTDLEPGRWHAKREGSAQTRDLMVSEDSQAAWLEGPAGTWTLSR